MDRYQLMFDRLNSKQQGAFVPFVMLGDPDQDTSYDIICALIEGGADALELGIPFSDPIADGPTIQHASIRALDSGITPARCFEIVSRVRQTYPDMPIGLLLYSNLVMVNGLDDFYQRASNAGVDSILIADVPLREAKPFKAAAAAHDIKHILIAPPNADDANLQAIAQQSEGYTYLLGRAGVTGAETAVTMPASHLVNKLKEFGSAPPILGFGISTPEQVSDAIKAGAAGAISGSATVNIVAANLQHPIEMTQQLTAFVQSMKLATC